MIFKRLLALPGALVLVLACGSDGDDNASGSSGNTLTTVGQADTGPPGATGGAQCITFNNLHGEASPPSVVRLYFQLSTCEGQPLAGKELSEFEIYENGTPLSTSEASAVLARDSRAFTLETLLLIDMSGSVRSQVEQVITAATTFVNSVDPDSAIAISTFDGRENPSTLIDFTRDRQALTLALESLREYVPVDDSTDLNGAFIRGLDLLDVRAGAAQTAGQIYNASLALFTDGRDQAARVPNSRATQRASTTAHSVYTIGLEGPGSELDAHHLESLSVRGSSVVAAAVEELAGKFAEVGQAITTLANSYYMFAYCSPKRGGTHEIKLVSRGRADGFVFSFSAEGFAGLCSVEHLLGTTPDDSTSTGTGSGADSAEATSGAASTTGP